MDKPKKITAATIKNFIKKNRDKLHLLVESSFSGNSDMVEPTGNKEFKPVVATRDNDYAERTMGIRGVWMVGQSRDYISAYNKDGWQGFECYNACGTFVVAIKADAPAQQPETEKAA